MSCLCIIVYIKINDICKDIAEDVETRFYTSNNELDRPLPTLLQQWGSLMTPYT